MKWKRWERRHHKGRPKTSNMISFDRHLVSSSKVTKKRHKTWKKSFSRTACRSSKHTVVLNRYCGKLFSNEGKCVEIFHQETYSRLDHLFEFTALNENVFFTRSVFLHRVQLTHRHVRTYPRSEPVCSSLPWQVAVRMKFLVFSEPSSPSSRTQHGAVTIVPRTARRQCQGWVGREGQIITPRKNLLFIWPRY